MPYEFLWIVKESAYKTTMTSPVAGTDSHYIRLSGANRFQMRKVPTKRKIAFGGGYAAKGHAKTDQNVQTGTLEFELCYTHAKMLLDWAITKGDQSGTPDIPWTTTIDDGDLASCSVFHGVTRSDGTIKRTKYLGTKVLTFKLSTSNTTGLVMCSFGLRASAIDGSDPDGTAFPAPADTAFPTDNVLFTHLTPTWDASTLTYPQSLEINIANGLDPRYFATSGLVFDRLRGREATASMSLLYTASPNWRSLFESINSDSLSFAFTNGVNTATIDFKANNLVDGVDDDLQPGKVYDQTVKWENQYDTASGKDVTFTYA